MKLFYFFTLALFLLFAGSAGAVDRYVAKCTNGIATYSPGGVGTCTGGSNLVYSSLTNAMAVASAGDNIYIRAGSWPGISSGATQPSGKGPAGTTGGGAASVISDFAAATLITVSAYCPGGVCEAVTMTIGAGSVVIGVGTTSYVSYENLIIDAAGAEQPVSIYGDGVTPSSVHHIRFLNNEIKNGSQNCIQVQATPSHHNWIKGNNIYGCGSGNIADPYRFHGIYNGESDSLYEQNTIHDIVGVANLTRGYCAQNYPTATRNTWRSNTFYNCEGMANGGNGNIIYNNVVRNSGNGIANSLGSGNIIYNNTIVNNTGSGIDAQGSSGAVIRNNIVANNPINIYHTGTGGTASNNLCSTTGGGTTNCSNIVANVSAINFTNYAGNDFTLQATSPALNVGTPTITGSISIPACGTAPYCYNSTAPDMGAFEYSAPLTCPAVSNALVASYSFEGNTNDITGNGHTAKFGSGWSYTAGRTGQGALSNGTSGITVPDHDALDPCGAFTYEAFISVPSVTTNYVVINKNPDSTAFLFASLDGYCGVARPIGGYSTATTSAVACSSASLTTGSFQHVAVTYDSTLASANVKLYVNGVSVASANGTLLLSPTTGTLQFCESSFGEICPNGTILDEVRIYNYARSAAEIASSITSPPVFTIKLDVSSLKIGPSVNLKVGVP